MSQLFPASSPPPGEIERALRRQGISVLAGVDEAGRGALFGPVVAAAVVLPVGLEIVGLDDSKKLSPEQRHMIAAEVRTHALAWGVGEADAGEVDRVNILQATFLAMNRALAETRRRFGREIELVLVDGPHAIAGLNLPQKPVVKGDQRSVNIAAASILAKTHRDALIVKLADDFPGYGLKSHKGYATARHRAALAKLGLTPLHRQTFCKKFQRKS